MNSIKYLLGFLSLFLFCFSNTFTANAGLFNASWDLSHNTERIGGAPLEKEKFADNYHGKVKISPGVPSEEHIANDLPLFTVSGEKGPINFNYILSRGLVTPPELGLFSLSTVKDEYIGFGGFVNNSLINSSQGGGMVLYLNPSEALSENTPFVVLNVIDYFFQISNADLLKFEFSESLHDLIPIQILTSFLALRSGVDGSISYGVVRRNNLIQRGVRKLLAIGSPKFRPNVDSLVIENIYRLNRLWPFFGKGVQLCTGGSSRPLINFEDLDHAALSTFQGYRTDNQLSAHISENDIKSFLSEEGFNDESLKHVRVNFSMGSHEGFMRLCRCLRSRGVKSGVVFPYGSYGFFPHSMATMRPQPYRVYLADIDRKAGDKLDIDSVETLVRQNADIETVFIEVKTMAGGVYEESEILKLINFAKLFDLQIIFDLTHFGMCFDASSIFPDVLRLCIKNDFHKFYALYTCSKIYALERARVGFVLSDASSCYEWLSEELDEELHHTLGEVPDLPYEVMRRLFSVPRSVREIYKSDNANLLRYNMNVMIAYIYGTRSPLIDEDLRTKVAAEVGPDFNSGVPGLRASYKPSGGMHMKVDLSQLIGKYLFGYKIKNAEIFTYILSSIYNVSTLHSYSFVDPRPTYLRLTFMNLIDIHRGMRAISNLIDAIDSSASRTDHTTMDSKL